MTPDKVVRWTLLLAMLVAIPVAAETARDGMSASERKACKAKGGSISTAGLAARPHCVLPTRDAGKACTSSSQCEAGCIATERYAPGANATGRCKESTEPFGCQARVEDGKAQPVICVD